MKKIFLMAWWVAAATASPLMASPAGIIHLSPRQQFRLSILAQPPRAIIDRHAMPVPAMIESDPSAVSIVAAPIDGRLQTVAGKHFPGLLSSAQPGTPLASIIPSLSVSEMTTLKLLLIKTKTRLAAAAVGRITAQKALARARKLYSENQAVSLQSVENAHAAYAQAQAIYRSDLAMQSAVKAWLHGSGHAAGIPIFPAHSGKIIKISAHNGQEVLTGDPIFKLMDTHQLLLRMFLPVDVAPPPNFQLKTRIGKTIYHPQYIGIAGHASQVTGGAVLLARLITHGHLRPGMPATVWIMSRALHLKHGFFIPQRSMVWWGGARWVFMKTKKNLFTPVRLVNSSPLPGGRFVPQLPPGALVVRGAQYLLSIEQSYSLKKSG